MAFETRSFPRFSPPPPHRYPHDFTFYVTPPVALFSISLARRRLGEGGSFQLFSDPHNSPTTLGQKYE